MGLLQPGCGGTEFRTWGCGVREDSGVFSAEELAGYLVDVGISGAVSTTRERSLRNYRLFGVGDPRVRLGVV
ncbi:phosphatase, partial [Streptomyces acidiscabies]|uniref:phosphatase n=1 Tax=Streptomyces acidiscabies TaxID=42234 RepID=UPI00273E8445